MLAVIENRPIGNTDAEAALLGSLLHDNKLIDRVADFLRSEDFADEFNGRVYTAIVDQVNCGTVASVISMLPLFRDDPALSDTTAREYFAGITLGASVTALGALDFARQIAELAKRRRLADALASALSSMRDTSEAMTYAQALASVEAATMAETDLGDGVVQMSAGDAFREMMETAAEGHVGVSAPAIACLNAQMGPIKPHHLVILAGRPGMGKTAVALSYAVSAAGAGHGVLFVSLEMSRTELMQRGAACMTFDGRNGIPYEAIRDNIVGEGGRRRVWEAGRAFSDMPLHIVDAGALTIGRLNMLVRRYKRRMASQGITLGLVVVDYLQLMHPDRARKSQYEEVSEVSKGLKSIAKTNGVGVMALAQLSREVEKREDKRPILSDLRDSGQIEQDADAICFLYRHEYYLRQAGPGKNEDAWMQSLADCEGAIDFIIAKRRNGKIGTATGEFHGGYMAVRG